MRFIWAALALLLVPVAALAQNYSSPTLQNLTLLGNQTVAGSLTLSGAFSSSLTSTTGSFAYYPVSLLFWNQNATFTGPGGGNYQQYTPFTTRGISGPTSKGNTGASIVKMDSYGNNPSSAFDVAQFIYSNKYGQNSNWGLIVQDDDFSGRPPQAFAGWNEEKDINAWGDDIPSFDPNYARPSGGNRVGIYHNYSTFALSGSIPGGTTWAANTAVNALSTTASGLTQATILKETVSAVPYIWYCTTSGTTGSTQPTFPSPSEFVGSIASGVLTVTSVVGGATPIATGEYVSGNGTISVIQITGQLSGTTGGVGTYSVPTGITVSSHAMFAAPNVTDGSAVWAFGVNFNETVHSGEFFTGTATIDTVLSGTNAISNAVLDTTQFSLGANAAAVRIGANQIIDFSGNGTVAGQNNHTLQYSSFYTQLAYQGASGPRFSRSMIPMARCRFRGLQISATAPLPAWLAGRLASILA